MAQTPPPSLDDRIHALCQELQDMILDFTLAFTPKDLIVKIDKTTRAPLQLQINKSTRAKLAPVYFGSATFEAVQAEAPIDGTIDKWFEAQSRSYRGMITYFRIDHGAWWWEREGVLNRFARESGVRLQAEQILLLDEIELGLRGVDLQPGVVHTDVPTIDGKGNATKIWINSKTDWDSLEGF